jgi:dynein light chain 4
MALEFKKVLAKPLVATEDMTAEMAGETVEIITAAVDKFLSTENYEKAAQAVKDGMDKKFGPTWHCCIGEGFGYDVTYNVRNMLLLYYGEVRSRTHIASSNSGNTGRASGRAANLEGRTAAALAGNPLYGGFVGPAPGFARDRGCRAGSSCCCSCNATLLVFLVCAQPPSYPTSRPSTCLSPPPQKLGILVFKF